MTQLYCSWTHTQRTPYPPTETLAHLCLQPFHKSKDIESAEMSTNWRIMKTQYTYTREFYSPAKTKNTLRNLKENELIWIRVYDVSYPQIRKVNTAGLSHTECNFQPSGMCVYMGVSVCKVLETKTVSRQGEKKDISKEESWVRWWNKWGMKMKRRPPGARRTQAKMGGWGEAKGSSTKG